MLKKPKQNLTVRNSTAEFLIFTGQAGAGGIEVRYQDETIWLTQKMMAEVFGTTRQNISLHLKNIFENKELSENSVVKDFLTTAADGKDYNTQFYNLDAVISVGYRVNSIRATRFRQWATQVLREFAIKGYLIDRKRMENGDFLGEDYFERLLEEIREIRLSERRFYQKITDIYATSVDYDKNAPATREFFAKVQNKLHYAIHGNTAPELIKARADSTRANMGLTGWAKSPGGKILKSDVAVAKNYLDKEEMESLGRIVGAYLDIAEDMAIRKIPVTMEGWSNRLDGFLKLGERQILQNAGSISAAIAKEHAESEFKKYRITQDKNIESDFDEEIKKIEKRTKTRKGKK